ncbi:MAG: D-alanyl-D-alanine carboxypeptidase family protein [Patescibacteria group bacterium]
MFDIRPPRTAKPAPPPDTSESTTSLPSQWYILVGLLIAAMGTAGYLAYTLDERNERIELLLRERNALSAELTTASSTIATIEQERSELRDALEELADDYRDAREQNDEFEDQIRDLAGTIGDLGTLADFDKELLQKYSRVYFLNENYYPQQLEEIEEDYLLDPADDEYFHARAMKHLEDLMDEAEEEGLDLKITSAYRSFDEQSELKGRYLQTYGEGANTFSADQGYSEHQLGTAVDFTTPAIDGLTEAFAETEEYEWLLENAHRYGFILSYPEGNEFYVFEPWHWRFVSRDLARDLHRSGETFYETSQRELDKYRLEFFD